MRARQFDITVFAADGDLAWFGTASTAFEMEQCVTGLHKRFPAPGFRVEVKAAVPADLPRWELTPSQEAALDSAYWETRWADDDEPEPDDDPDD